MQWLAHVNAALSAGAKLLAEKREALEAADALAPLELLLQHLDVAAASGAVESSKAKNPAPTPDEIMGVSSDQESVRWSPPETV